jgi:hypothetical protein
VLVGLLVVALEVGATGAAGGPTGAGIPPAPPAIAAPLVGESVPAARVLAAWDDARAAAWTARDPGALRRLFLRGSTAADADARLLRRYTAHGVRWTRLDTQRFSVSVLRRSDVRLRLAVVDRVVGAASTPRRCLPLLAAAPARRVVELRSSAGRWVVAAVSGPGRR